MPIELLAVLPNSVVGVRAVGEVDDDDFEKVPEPSIQAATGLSRQVRGPLVLSGLWW